MPVFFIVLLCFCLFIVVVFLAGGGGGRGSVGLFSSFRRRVVGVKSKYFTIYTRPCYRCHFTMLPKYVKHYTQY